MFKFPSFAFLLRTIFASLARVHEPRPNDDKFSTQHIPTLLPQYLQAPARRSKHLNSTDRNIVGRGMLHAFGHPVATCCDMLRVEN